MKQKKRKSRMRPKYSRSLEIIKRIVENKFQVNIDMVTRVRSHVYARYIFYRLCKDFTFCSLNQIAEVVNKNHATVMHGLQQFENLKFTNDREYLDPYHELREELTKKLSTATSKDQYFTIDDLIEQNIYLNEKCDNLKTFIKNALLKEYDDFFHLAKKNYGYEPHHMKQKYDVLNKNLEKII